MNEQWRDVVGYEGIYQISDLGQVRRIKAGKRTKIGLVLKPQMAGGTTKYPAVMLYRGSKTTRKRHWVHRLVTAAFLGPLPEGWEVNHKNGEKSDARASNLEYVTKSGNRIHAIIVLGLEAANKGSRHPFAVLDEDKVLEIRNLYATGQYYMRELAVRFGVCRAVITDIVNHRTWTHVGGPYSPITYRPLKPTRPGNAKLDPDQVRQIRELATTHTQRDLGRMFGVSKTLIAAIIHRRIWQDIM